MELKGFYNALVNVGIYNLKSVFFKSFIGQNVLRADRIHDNTDALECDKYIFLKANYNKITL